MIFRVPGPCTILWNNDAIGVTESGVIIKSTPNWVPLLDDGHGAEPADYLWAGRTITIECIGLDESSITSANLFANSLKGGKLVGEALQMSTSPQKALRITERDGEIWQALHTEPLPPELVLTATQELKMPLIFMVMHDVNGNLFSTLPSYIPS